MDVKLTIFWKLFILTVLMIPMAININRLLKYFVLHSVGIAVVAIVVLGAVFGTIVMVCKHHFARQTLTTNWHLYAFSQFAATSVLSFGIGLEQDGYISDFVSEYLKSGEPYLFCPYGRAVCYFDGFPTYFFYLYMIYAISNNKCYRSVALYWAGTLINSLVILYLGILWGQLGLYPSSILNVPYLVVPVAVAWTLLHERPQLQKSKSQPLHLSKRPLDVLLMAMIITAAVIAIIRGTAVMDNNVGIANYYQQKIEPLLMLDSPSPFIKIQMLVYLFYILPIYVLSIYGLITPNCLWLKDLTLFHAGVMAQGQITYIATALHPGIPTQFQIPGTEEAQSLFWFGNVFVLLLPHLLLLRCYVSNVSSKSNKKNLKK